MANDGIYSFFSVNKQASVGVLFVLLLTVGMFYPSISTMVEYWYEHEEFGHAFLLPAISLYFIWLKRYEIAATEVTNTWVGILIVLVGALFFLLGILSAIYTIQQYSLVLTLIGIFVSLFGTKASKKVAIPLLLLFFMVPLPGFLYNTISNKLQLLSSEIGVYVIRLFDISVYLEGNVIDLGVYKLQVVDACSGLRYLFPLMTLGLIAAYIFRSSKLNKVIIFLSTIPITILMNSFRIGMIGVLVEYYGIAMAEGFLHDFEGWIIFMACMVILFLEMWLLSLLSNKNQSFGELFNLDAVNSEQLGENQSESIKLSRTVLYIIPILLLGLTMSEVIGKRVDEIPDRKSFVSFPVEINEYSGRKETFDYKIIDALNFDDYLTANYISEDKGAPINVYVGYYDTQRADKVPHSPKACLPGGGWVITHSDVVHLPMNDGLSIPANRVVIHKAGTKQLVYYWFKQRDRYIASEYLVKWYLLIDSMFKNRTDGALVRFVTQMKTGESLAEAETRLQEFIAEANPLLTNYIPD